MPSTLAKLNRHISLGLSIGPSVRVHQLKIYYDTVFKLHIWIPHQKYT